MRKRLFLFNTLGRQLEEFIPYNPEKVGMYSCGPTVYSYAHIGNLRAYFFADILKRTLRYAGYPVHHVMNITDVGHLTTDEDQGDDKLEVAAAKSGRSAWELADFFTKQFLEDLKALKIELPQVICKATDHIPEQIALIRRLDEKGFTYRTGDGIYFDSSKFPSYGKLALLNESGLQSGIRVSLGEKQHATDFALWKFSDFSAKRQMEWDSPWGKGFPGRHIECSAMSMKYLGEQFDIHTGGIDHIPVHHTNEIAQSEAATGKRPFVKYWLHEEFLAMDQSIKMSKSSGEVLTLETLRKKGYDPVEIRFFLLMAHYRKPQQFRFDLLDSAKSALDRLRRRYLEFSSDAGASSLSAAGLNLLNEFELALFEDLNLPEVLSVVWRVVDANLSGGEKAFLLLRFDEVLGLGLQESRPEVDIPLEVQALVQERESARQQKNWQRSDELRAEIEAHGFEVRDTSSGSQVGKRR